MKRRAVLKTIGTAAKSKGLTYTEVELTKHTGAIVGGLRSTLARHSEIDEITVKKFYQQFEDVLGKGVLEVSTYTITATRSPRGMWILQCDEVPGALSQTRRLSDAPALMREAIAFVAEVPPETVQVRLVVDVSPTVSEHLAATKSAIAAMRESQHRAAALSRQTARELKAIGLTGADIATVMEVSPQRVSQLLSAKG